MNYIAFIRGIGPGNPNMSNQNLCRVLESLGYENVRAVISSGNIIFSADHRGEEAMQRDIQRALNQQLGIAGFTIVRSRQEIEDLVRRNPFGSKQHSKENYQTVTFFASHEKKEPIVRDHLTTKRLTDRELCMVTNSEKIPGPETMRLLEKSYGKDITTRTWKTIEKVLTKLEELG